MFGLIVVSVRGGESLSDEKFATVGDVKRHVRERLADVSSYWRVKIIDENGAEIVRGTRAGRSGTGKRWVWEDIADNG